MPKPVVVKKKTMDADALSALREALLPALTDFLEGQNGTDPAADPAADPAVDPVAEPAVELSPEEQAAKKAVEEAAAVEANVDPEVTGDEGEEAGAVVGLIQQLIAALNGSEATPAVGDEKLDTDPVEKKLGDEDGEEQTAAKPKEGVTMDAMFAAVAKRDELYKRVSRVVGTFDHAAMSHDKVAKYGVKKLGIKCADGHEVTALNAYLLATDKAAETAAKPKIVGDSMPSSSELDAYLAGKDK